MSRLAKFCARLSQSPFVQKSRDWPLKFSRKASFSQDEEDLFVLNRIFNGMKCAGTYIDIGASHPVRLSNTYLFYKCGWRGVVVEPNPMMIPRHRHWRPEDVHMQCVVGESDGKANFYHLYPSVLSTVSEQQMQMRVDHGAILVRQDTLDQFTINTLLDRMKIKHKIDFMSVDVEGLDSEIARQIRDLSNEMRPKALCIEVMSPEVGLDLRNTLGSVYGFCHEIGYNLIFWNEPAAA